MSEEKVMKAAERLVEASGVSYAYSSGSSTGMYTISPSVSTWTDFINAQNELFNVHIKDLDGVTHVFFGVTKEMRDAYKSFPKRWPEKYKSVRAIKVRNTAAEKFRELVEDRRMFLGNTGSGRVALRGSDPVWITANDTSPLVVDEYGKGVGYVGGS